jgi:hypothetical protein
MPTWINNKPSDSNKVKHHQDHGIGIGMKNASVWLLVVSPLNR